MKVGFTDIRSRFYRRILRVVDKQYIFDFDVYIWYLMLYAFGICEGVFRVLYFFRTVFINIQDSSFSIFDSIFVFVLQYEFVNFRIDL